MHAGGEAVLITANIIHTESFLRLAADWFEQDDVNAAGRRHQLAERLAPYRQFM